MIINKQNNKRQWKWFFLLYLISLTGFTVIALLIKGLVYWLSCC